MRLFIAEKPSLGLAVATALGITKKEHGFIKCNGGNIVTWAVGHLLQSFKPDDYDESLKKWDTESLPIIPSQWKLKITPTMEKQFKTVERLISQAETIVNVGDPDRQGQLIIDEVIDFCDAKQEVLRVLISDLNPEPVKKAIAKIQSNSLTQSLGEAAKAMGQADWLYGMNLTRAYTLAGRSAGLQHVLSIGRVQSPLLGLIVRRDLEIENFIKKPFYGIESEFIAKEGLLKAKWEVMADASLIDEDGRLLEKPSATIIKKMKEGEAVVKSVECKKITSRPPLLFSLSELQKEASKSLGLTSIEILDIAQSLYEKLITTYPRSDCRYLPEDQLSQAEKNSSVILDTFPEFKTIESSLSFESKSPSFDDSKITAHHAIVPTGKKPESLNKNELNVYKIICRQYLSQFLGDKISSKTEITIGIGSEIFKTNGMILNHPGYSILYTKKEDTLLPMVKEGETLTIKELKSVKKMTTPPKRFTESSLLSAMTGIAKFLKDKELAIALKDTDGLGTEATRANIIEILVKREFVVRDKKNFISTTLGRDLIKSLPEILTWPDMTAAWEVQLNEISKGNKNRLDFIEEISDKVRTLVNYSKNNKMVVDLKEHSCPTCNLPLRKLRKKDKTYFWACSGYKESTCSFTTEDDKGSPNTIIHPCPKCNKPLSKRNGENGMFWGCTGFAQGCNYSCNNKANKPDHKKIKTEDKGSDACIKCSKRIVRRYSKGKDFHFWVHSEDSPDCVKFIKDVDGSPDQK